MHWVLALLIVAVSISLTTGANVLIALSLNAGRHLTYTPAAAVLVQEVLKGCVSLALVLFSSAACRRAGGRPQSDDLGVLSERYEETGAEGDGAAGAHSGALQWGEVVAGSAEGSEGDATGEEIGSASLQSFLSKLEHVNTAPSARGHLTQSAGPQRSCSAACPGTTLPRWSAPVSEFLRSSLPYSIPAAIFTLVNNLQYYVLQWVDVTTQALMGNLNIVFTALMFRFVLCREVTAMQWLALVLLTAGLVMTQSADLMNEEDDEKETYVLGAITMLCTVGASALGNIMTELVYKRHSSMSIHAQNVRMYFWGVVCNGAMLLTIQRRAMNEPLLVELEGFATAMSTIVLVIIAFNTLKGLVTSFLLKHLDNMARVYTNVGAMLLTTVIGIIAFGHPLSLGFAAGAALVMASSYLFYTNGPAEREQLLAVDDVQFVIDEGDLPPEAYSSLRLDAQRAVIEGQHGGKVEHGGS